MFYVIMAYSLTFLSLSFLTLYVFWWGKKQEKQVTKNKNALKAYEA